MSDRTEYGNTNWTGDGFGTGHKGITDIARSYFVHSNVEFPSRGCDDRCVCL
jgi:hypothetical protein